MLYFIVVVSCVFPSIYPFYERDFYSELLQGDPTQVLNPIITNSGLQSEKKLWFYLSFKLVCSHDQFSSFGEFQIENDGWLLSTWSKCLTQYIGKAIILIFKVEKSVFSKVEFCKHFSISRWSHESKILKCGYGSALTFCDPWVNAVFLMNYSKRSLSIWHEKPHLAISVDELSGRDQMGQKKPFFKKSRGHIKRLQKVRLNSKVWIKTCRTSHDDGDHWSGTALVFSKTYRPHPFSGEDDNTNPSLSFCQKVDFTPKTIIYRPTSVFALYRKKDTITVNIFS